MFARYIFMAEMKDRNMKHCPRCNQAFECRADNIQHCQCYAVQLTGKEMEWIASQYQGCLCNRCLLEIYGTNKKLIHQ